MYGKRPDPEALAVELRRFAVALHADSRLQIDAAAARLLADETVARALVAVEADGAAPHEERRRRAYGACIADNRRRMRLALDADAEANAPPPAPRPTRYDDAVAAAMAHLGADLREALLVVTLGGFSHEEAALALDVPLATAANRLIRARRTLTLALRGAESDGPRAPRNPPRLRVVK